MKHFIITFCILLSCSFNFAQHNEKDIKDLVYFQPVFVHKKPNKPKVLYQRFEELSEIGLDSVLKGQRNKYRIKGKYSGAFGDVEKKELVEIFKGFKKKKDITEHIISTLDIITQTVDNPLCAFFVIETRSSTTVYTTPISKVKLHMIIYDTKNKRIVFTETSKNLPPKGNGGYAHVVIKDLNYIYRTLYKL